MESNKSAPSKNSFLANTRLISAPRNRARTHNQQQEQEDSLQRALYRLPGDVMEDDSSSDPRGPASEPGSLHVSSPPLQRHVRARSAYRQRNARMRQLVQEKVITPMHEMTNAAVAKPKNEAAGVVFEKPEIVETSLTETGPLPDAVVSEEVIVADEPETDEEEFQQYNSATNHVHVQPDEDGSPPAKRAKKFARIAKTITLLNRKSNSSVAEASEANENVDASDDDNDFAQHLTYNIFATAHNQDTMTVRDLFDPKVVVDSGSNVYYYWLCVVSGAYLYNLLLVVFRCVFVEEMSFWWRMGFLIADIVSDCVYLLDFYVRSKTGYLEQGLLERDMTKIRKLYKRSWKIKVDGASVIAADFVFELIFSTPKPVLRFNRLFKIGRIRSCIAATETRISSPNVFRVFCVISYILVLIHWNATFYFLMSLNIGIGNDAWVYGDKNKQSLPEGVMDSVFRRYVYSFYWSTLILTTIGEVPGPVESAEFAFVTVDLMCGVLIFATIVGNVGSMISNMSAASADFQTRVDAIKQFMELRNVSKNLQARVIKWFDYLWDNRQSLADPEVLKILPVNLQTEIAMQVHYETLRKVRLFQDCEAGLLGELVLKLQLQVFSPGDYVCKKGDIGREMYIVKRGRLNLMSDPGKVINFMQEGSVIGELSILNVPGSLNGNRRSANIVSLGYSDLFSLTKHDLVEALKDYPDAKRVLTFKARDILKKDNLLDEKVPEETRTPEEQLQEMQNQVTILQTRLAKLFAEQLNSTQKLLYRIEYLEAKLSKYEDVNSYINEHGHIKFYRSHEEEDAELRHISQTSESDL